MPATLEEAEAWVARVMTENGFRNPWARCLVFTRRLSVWFSPEGHVTERRRSTPDDPGHPFMRIGNQPFLLRAKSR